MAKIVVTVKAHLDTLEAEQADKDDPISVPNLKELASIANISEKHFLRIVNNRVKTTNLKTIALIVQELRRLGFQTEISDVLRYVD